MKINSCVFLDFTVAVMPGGYLWAAPARVKCLPRLRLVPPFAHWHGYCATLALADAFLRMMTCQPVVRGGGGGVVFIRAYLFAIHIEVVKLFYESPNRLHHARLARDT